MVLQSTVTILIVTKTKLNYILTYFDKRFSYLEIYIKNVYVRK